MFCQKCGSEIPSGANWCTECGTLRADIKLCQNCGNPIGKECIVCPKCKKQMEEIRAVQPNMDTEQTKCRVNIMRQANGSFSARLFIIYVDNVRTAEIKNGGMISLLLDQGRHILSFGIGQKIKSSITLDLIGGGIENVVCCASGSGIESTITPVDICYPITNVPTNSQSGGIGCLSVFLIVIGLFLLLWSFGIIKPYIFFYQIK